MTIMIIMIIYCLHHPESLFVFLWSWLSFVIFVAEHERDEDFLWYFLPEKLVELVHDYPPTLLPFHLWKRFQISCDVYGFHVALKVIMTPPFIPFPPPPGLARTLSQNSDRSAKNWKINWSCSLVKYSIGEAFSFQKSILLYHWFPDDTRLRFLHNTLIEIF